MKQSLHSTECISYFRRPFQKGKISKKKTVQDWKTNGSETSYNSELTSQQDYAASLVYLFLIYKQIRFNFVLIQYKLCEYYFLLTLLFINSLQNDCVNLSLFNCIRKLFTKYKSLTNICVQFYLKIRKCFILFKITCTFNYKTF